MPIAIQKHATAMVARRTAPAKGSEHAASQKSRSRGQMPDRRPRSQIASNLYVAYDSDDFRLAGAPSTKCPIGMKFHAPSPRSPQMRETASKSWKYKQFRDFSLGPTGIRASAGQLVAIWRPPSWKLGLAAAQIRALAVRRVDLLARRADSRN